MSKKKWIIIISSVVVVAVVIGISMSGGNGEEKFGFGNTEFGN